MIPPQSLDSPRPNGTVQRLGGSHRFANDRRSLEANSNRTGPLQGPPRTNEPQPATTGSVISLPPLFPQSLDSPVTPCTLWVQLSLPFTPRAERIPAAIDRTTGAYAVRYVRRLGEHGAPLPASGLRRANGE